MIRVDRSGDICTVTIDRPDKAGALTRDMLLQIRAAVQEARTAKVFILTGSGSVFSAGADLDAARAGLATDPVWEDLSAAIAALPGLSIAALNGTVAGGAFGMVLACDLRIGVETAKFFYPVMKLGFLPQHSDPARLCALVGPARAKMILMAGQKIDASSALQWGLLDELVAPSDLMERALAVGTDAMSADLSHIAAIKSLIGQECADA